MTGNDPVEPTVTRCIMCGRKIEFRNLASIKEDQSTHYPPFVQNTRGQERLSENKNRVVAINGVKYMFDSDFCVTTFKKFQLIYGDGFCADLTRWLGDKDSD
jgi:hypothetical protein